MGYSWQICAPSGLLLANLCSELRHKREINDVHMETVTVDRWKDRKREIVSGVTDGKAEKGQKHHGLDPKGLVWRTTIL